MRLALKDDVINGFSYSFCQALFKKITKLQAEDKIFKEGERKAEEESRRECRSELTDMAAVVLANLDEQIRCGSHISLYDSQMKPKELKKNISFVEEFLAIFQEENKTWHKF